MARRESVQGLWSSRFAFVLAATGSAIGLGNLWKFPYITQDNGGGAFILIYLICIGIVGLPILMSEILLGRRGRRNPVKTMELLGEEEGGSKNWKIIGLWGMVAGFLILSFYAVVGGWGFFYVFKSLTGTFNGATAESVGNVFGNFVSDWKLVLLVHTFFLLTTALIVGRGIKGGIESAVKLLMPLLVLLLLIMLVYCMRLDSFSQSVSFLFDFDLSKLNKESWIVALGHAFFTLSLGMGGVMAYGAYLPQNASIGKTAILVAFVDTFIALLACMVIFPIVFKYGISFENADGELSAGLIFAALPVGFSEMPGTYVVSLAFFILLSLAALTSAISLLEPVVAWTSENHGMSRVKATSVCTLIVWLLGLATVFSLNLLSGEEYQFWKGTLFDNIDYFTSNIMLPIGGVAISLFAGWVMCRVSSSDELAMGTGFFYNLWLWLTRIVAPAVVVFIVLIEFGVIKP